MVLRHDMILFKRELSEHVALQRIEGEKVCN